VTEGKELLGESPIKIATGMNFQRILELEIIPIKISTGKRKHSPMGIAIGRIPNINYNRNESPTQITTGMNPQHKLQPE
jgi:hypothetical protein